MLSLQIKCFLVLTFCASLSIAAKCAGEGWLLNDKKCYKSFEALSTQAEGAEICNSEYIVGDSNHPRLLRVENKKEQDFIIDWIFNSTLSPGVWLGAERSVEGDSFQWPSGKGIFFANWALGSPSENYVRGCVEMQSDLTKANAGISLRHFVTFDETPVGLLFCPC